MIDGDIEKSLHLCRVQIDRHHPIGPGPLSRLATSLAVIGVRPSSLLVLPGVSEIRDHRRHPLALARRSVSIQMNNSIRWAFTG